MLFGTFAAYVLKGVLHAEHVVTFEVLLLSFAEPALEFYAVGLFPESCVLHTCKSISVDVYC
jgi:hypothetical protein